MCLLRGMESIFKYNPVNFRLQSVNLPMFESFKRKHTSPSNRYLAAISLGPFHERMPTPSVTPAPISHPVSSQPPLHCPGSRFQIHKGTISARKCRLAYREYWSRCTVCLSTSFLTYFPNFSDCQCSELHHISFRTVLTYSKYTIISHSFLDSRNWNSVVKYRIIIILLYSPRPFSNYFTLGVSITKFCHAD